MLESETGLLDWRTASGTTVLVSLRHDEPAEQTRVRLKLGEALDWFASCPFLEVCVWETLRGQSSNEATLLLESILGFFVRILGPCVVVSLYPLYLFGRRYCLSERGTPCSFV